MANSGYPKRIGASPLRDKAIAYRVGALVVFAVAFGILTFAPSMLFALLIVPLLGILDQKRWHGRIYDFFSIYAVVVAIPVTAAALLT
ncbi:MAG: hypothetical protein O9293_04240 [Porphyrobacter sp.]|nr:hypothetical protein [Porphyrobacter sp.]